MQCYIQSINITYILEGPSMGLIPQPSHCTPWKIPNVILEGPETSLEIGDGEGPERKILRTMMAIEDSIEREGVEGQKRL